MIGARQMNAGLPVLRRFDRLVRCIVIVAANTSAGADDNLRRVSDLPAAGEQFAAAAQVAAENGLVAARVRALHSLGTVQLALTGASAALAEARDLAESAGLLATVAAADLVLAEATLLSQGPAAGAEAATRAGALATRLGLQDVGAGSALMRAWALALGSDRAGAEADLESVAPLLS